MIVYGAGVCTKMEASPGNFLVEIISWGRRPVVNECNGMNLQKLGYNPSN